VAATAHQHHADGGYDEYAGSGAVLGPYASTVRFDQALDDRQTESESLRSRLTIDHPIERVKQVGNVLIRNARSTI
jgi:hypothetical protein